jgi:transposase
MHSPDNTIDVVRLSAGVLPTPDALMRTVLEQQRRIDQQAEIVEKKSQVIASQKATIAILEEQLRLAKHKRFGTSSEKNPRQEDFFADEAETLADGDADTDDGEREPEPGTGGDTGTSRQKRTPPRRKGLNPDLPRVRHESRLSDEQREGAIDTFFVRVKEELDIEPAKAQVIEYWQEKAVRLDEHGERTLTVAARPVHPLGKSIASVNLLSWLIIAKYGDGMPLYRLEGIVQRYGGDISRTTMANWLIRLHAVLKPLLKRLETVQLSGDYLQGDETRMQVLKEPGMAPTGTKWIWLMRGGPPGKPVVLFNYDKSRGGAVAERLLESYTGRYFQSDGYAGYDRACAAKAIVHLGCWDHARRKVVDAIKVQPKSSAKAKPSVAMVMLSKIDALYRLEREFKELDDDERYERRQKQSVPKLASLRKWLEQKQPKVVPDSLTRTAINYALNQWDHLERYCQHGQLRISNVLAENALRPFAVGRRAWLFADTPDGARASAAYFSLIETAKANGIEPSVYIKHVVANIATADTDEALDALLPWNMS